MTTPLPAIAADSTKAAAYASITSAEYAEDAARLVATCAQNQATATSMAGALTDLAEPIVELLRSHREDDTAQQLHEAMGHVAEAVRQLGAGFAELQERLEAHGKAWEREAAVWRHIVSVGGQ